VSRVPVNTNDGVVGDEGGGESGDDRVGKVVFVDLNAQEGSVGTSSPNNLVDFIVYEARRGSNVRGEVINHKGQRRGRSCVEIVDGVDLNKTSLTRQRRRLGVGT